jgi:hypothetical protein
MLSPDARHWGHGIGSSEAGCSKGSTLSPAPLGRLFYGLAPEEPASKMQSEPSFLTEQFPSLFFLHKYQFASPPFYTSPSPHSLSIRAVLMAELRLRSQSSSPKPLTKNAANKNALALTAAPRTHLLTRLLYVTSAILSMLCLAYVSRRERTPLPDAYALCSRSGAHIYTVDPDYPRVQCMVVQGSHIVDVGAIGM